MSDVKQMGAHLTELHLTRSARTLVTDSQAMHRTLTHAARNSTRLLWGLPRADLLIVQAESPIRVSDLPGVVSESHSAPTPLGHAPGSQIIVSLIANPVSTPRATGKRTPLPMTEWEGWLKRKLAGAMEVDDLEMQDLGGRHGKRHSMTVVHRLVAFTGSGTVLDSSVLDDLILSGVGPAKGYGAGLLLVGAA